MKTKIKVCSNNLGSTFIDWLSPTEKNKLIKALKASEGWTHLGIVKNLSKLKDYFYINGKEIFKREIK